MASPIELATSDAPAPERKRKSRWDNTICTAEIGPAPTDREFDGYCEETGVTEAADKHACAEDSLGAWRSASMADCVSRCQSLCANCVNLKRNCIADR